MSMFKIYSLKLNLKIKKIC